MTLLDRAVVEMQRRAASLAEEVTTWKESASANVDQLGIHKSQLDSLKEMMDSLLARQDKLLEQLSSVLPPQKFAEIFYRLVNEIVGTHDLWRIFRYIFTQLEDQRLGPLVDAADLVASDCYLTCLNRARAWGLITEKQFREPPLVYLEADISPATANRGAKVQSLGFPVRQYRDLRLPIPIVTMPFDHADCIWLLCALHHEVGHNLDQDFKLGRELKQHLDKTLDTRGVPSDRRTIWIGWTSEILADTIGVLLGGAGFGYTLTSLLLLLAPRWTTLDLEGEHPDNFVRIYLVVALLRECGVEALKQTADTIMSTRDTLPKPASIQPYLDDCTVVATIFLTQSLRALGERPMRDLVPDPAGDAKQAARLAKFLLTGSGFDEPVTPVPWRLVPVAAELALVGMDKPDAAALKSLQDSSLKYLKGLNRPEFLGAADRNDFMRQLVDEIDFTEVSRW